VFVGGKPGDPVARLVGFTKESIPTNVTMRFTLISVVPGGMDGEIAMHGDMIVHPYRHEDGALYWAWQLEREEDLPHVVPDFRPAAMH
jgi:hypothetical protein